MDAAPIKVTVTRVPHLNWAYAPTIYIRPDIIVDETPIDVATLKTACDKALKGFQADIDRRIIEAMKGSL